MGQDKPSHSRFSWSDLSISSLEADIAYFDARLTLLNEKPASYYQDAQIRAYRELETILGEHLQRLRQAHGKSRNQKKRR